MVHLGAPAQRLLEARRADRRDHELLDVDAGVGVRAAVEDVHHRHRQDVRVRAADVAEQRQPGGLGGGLGHGQRHAEDRVGAQPGLVRGAVEVEQRLVDQPLLVGVEPMTAGAISSSTASTAFSTPLPPYRAPPSRSSTASCSPVEAPDGTAARAKRAVDQGHLDLDRRVAPGVEDLAGSDLLDDGHWRLLAWWA